MILDVLENQECYSYPENTLEISAEDQIWNEETLTQLREEHNVFFMSNGMDSVTPIKIILNSENKPTLFGIGSEDDGTIFFNEFMSIKWIDSLINELQTIKKTYKL